MAEIKEREVDEEVYETQGIQDDWDRINQEKMMYMKFSGSTYNQ